MKNEYLTLYAIVDLFLWHMLESKVVKLIDGDIVLTVPYNSLTKLDKMVLKDTIDIINFLHRELNEHSFKIIKDKYKKLIDSLTNSKMVKEGWASLPAGIAVYYDYAKNQRKKFNVHKGRVEKMISLITEIGKVEGGKPFKNLSPLALNSYKMGEIIYKQING